MSRSFLGFLENCQEYGLIDSVFSKGQLTSVGFFKILKLLVEKGNHSESQLDEMDWDSVLNAAYNESGASSKLMSSNFILTTPSGDQFYLMCGLSSLVFYSRKFNLDICDVFEKLSDSDCFVSESIISDRKYGFGPIEIRRI